MRSGLDDRSTGRSAEGILGAVLRQVQDIPEIEGKVIPGEGIEHGMRVRGGVHAGEAAADLGGQATLGGKAHGQGGAVQAADGIEVKGVGRTRHPLHPIDGVGPPGGRGEVGAVGSLRHHVGGGAHHGDGGGRVGAHDRRIGWDSGTIIKRYGQQLFSLPLASIFVREVRLRPCRTVRAQGCLPDHFLSWVGGCRVLPEENSGWVWVDG